MDAATHPGTARTGAPAANGHLSGAAPPARRPLRTPALFLASALHLLTTGCDDLGSAPVPTPGSARGAASGAATARATGAPSPATSGSAAVIADHLELQKFVLTSGVKAREPVDLLDAAKPGTRVYGHVTVRNRTAGSKRISLSFRVNGEERTMVDLDIEKSWSWRSWAYVTLRKEDKGEITVHVFDDHGAEMGTQSIPIR